MKCLFVGGDHDGEMVDVDPYMPEVKLPSKLRMPFPTIRNATTTVPSSVQSYKREEFVDADGKGYVVYFGGNPAQPIRMLIEGYANLQAKLIELESRQ